MNRAIPALAEWLLQEPVRVVVEIENHDVGDLDILAELKREFVTEFGKTVSERRQT